MISKYVKINTFIAFIAMVGGMQIFGLVGLFIGPAIVAMATGMIKELIRVPLKDNSKNKEEALNVEKVVVENVEQVVIDNNK
jgi:predicted PurR-regulated permease PerM